MRDRVTSRRGIREMPTELWAVYLVEERIEVNDYLKKRGYKDWDNNTGVVYFIQAEDGPIKIGYSSRPIKHRLSALQSTNAKRLTLLATIAGTLDLERRAHHWFKNGRIHGEWFSKDTKGLPELIEWAQARLPV